MNENDLISGSYVDERHSGQLPGHGAIRWRARLLGPHTWRWLDIGGGRPEQAILVRCYAGRPHAPREGDIEVAEPGTALFSSDWVKAENAATNNSTFLEKSRG